LDTISYAKVAKLDVMTKAMPLFNQGYFIRGDGKIDAPKHIDHNTPWIYTGNPGTRKFRKCPLWHKVYFPYYNIVPIGCHECWKVVVKPKTLRELMELHEVMKTLDSRPGKCGIEQRQTVFGLYGGYFYNDSLEAGRECWEFVRSLVNDINPNISVILKRACTEFEHAFGPSNQWEISDDQRDLEEQLDQLFVQNIPWYPQPEQLKRPIIRDWIHVAYTYGAETYKQVTNSKPLFPPYVTYHNDMEV